MQVVRCSLLLGLLFWGVALTPPSSLLAQNAGEMQIGYATGLDSIYIFDLESFQQADRVFADQLATSLSSSPKFGQNKRLYVADQAQRGIHVFDLEGQSFLDDEFISLAGEPNDFEIIGSIAVITDFANRKLYVVDLSTGELTQELDVAGPAANEIAISPDGRRLFVTTYDFRESVPHRSSHPVVAFELLSFGTSLQVLSGVAIPLQRMSDGQVIPYVASSVDVSSDGSRVYVLAINDYEEDPAVFVLDALTLQVLELIPVDLGGRAREPLVNTLVLSPDDRTIGISAFTNGLALIDVETGETRILFPSGDDRLIASSTFGVSFGPGGGQVYAIGNRGSPLGFIAGFDVASGEQLGALTLNRQPLLYMAIPGGKTF